MEKEINFLFGRRNFEELIKKYEKNPENFPLKEVFTRKNPQKDLQAKILSKLPNSVRIHFCTDSELDKLVSGKNHQGIVGKATQTRLTVKGWTEFLDHVEKESGPFLVLDRIQDPGNFGNILRTAECFGVSAVIWPERESVGITPVVEKISAGAVHHLNLFRISNLMNGIRRLKELGFWVVATSDRGEADWSSLPEKEKIVLIMGNEGEGVKNILMQEADFLVQIPMHGNISSLNVSVATGICLDRIVSR